MKSIKKKQKIYIWFKIFEKYLNFTKQQKIKKNNIESLIFDFN